MLILCVKLSTAIELAIDVTQLKLIANHENVLSVAEL